MADKHIDKRTSSQWDETWGNPSYVYSKVGMTPDDVHNAIKENEARHSAEVSANEDIERHL